jgi:hypothetical protein
MKRWILGINVALLGILFVAFLVWRLKLAHDINDQLAAIRAAGLPSNAEELDKYYNHVPDAQNAALMMEDAFTILQNYPDARSNDVDHLKHSLEKWSSFTPEQIALLSGYVQINSNALAKAEEALQLSQCRYPIDFSQGLSTLLPHLDPLKTLCLLEKFHASMALDAHHPSEASDNIVSIIGLASTLDAEPIVISKLVRISLLNIAVDALAQRLNYGEISVQEAKKLDEVFLKATKTNQMVNGLVGDRAMNINIFRMTWADLKKYSDSDDDTSRLPQSNSRPLIYRVSGIFERDLRFYLQDMQTNISLAAMPPPNYLQSSNASAQMMDLASRNYYFISVLLCPELGSLVAKDDYQLAQMRLADVALKIEHFRADEGRLPATLDELVPKYLSAVTIDPFDGQPLRFHHLDKGYVIYSVGRDGHDNGGRERPPDAKSSDRTEYDITFKVER